MQNENAQRIVTAIPQKPWKNESSTRFALCRGFKREDSVNSNDVELGLFAKPYWKKQ